MKQKKLQELQQILPELFEDGEIVPDKLYDIFKDRTSAATEHYSFTWNGKRDCYRTIREKTNATLKVDEDKTIPNGDNVFIEGDNLEVLKLLQLSYHKKVKMIYIDPPYNKDKDFVYSDTWGDTIQNYLIQTDQLRDEGYTTTKTNSTGRRHTNWLNMIYPRLWLSRNLLKDDGVIFVSIDDDEVHNLRKVMDEIYGEENFVGQLVWQKRKGGGNDSFFVAVDHEYVLVYAKSIEKQSKEWRIPYQEKHLKRYKEEDSNGRYYWDTLHRGGLQSPIVYDVTCPDGSVIKDGTWQISKDTFNKKLLKKEIQIIKKDNHKWSVQHKIYQPKGRVFRSIYSDHSNSDSAGEIKSLFGVNKFFDTPKPVGLLKSLIELISLKDKDIILDFFAGSGTTAHAVMGLNQKDGGNRKYILVQLPEATDEKSEAYKAGYKKISDITKERIKRAMKKLDYKDGFKSFRLDNSNFQVFKEVKKRPDMSYEEIEKMLKMSMFHENILTQGAKELDIVYEVGLKNGFTLSAEIEEVKTDKYSFMTLSEDERVFYFSFDKKIEGDIVHDVPKDAKLICYEKALTTNVKLNLRENLDLEVL